MTGTRVFTNQTNVQVSSIITPTTYLNNASAHNYLYPLTTAKVDAEGIQLYFSAHSSLAPPLLPT